MKSSNGEHANTGRETKPTRIPGHQIGSRRDALGAPGGDAPAPGPAPLTYGPLAIVPFRGRGRLGVVPPGSVVLASTNTCHRTRTYPCVWASGISADFPHTRRAIRG